MNQITLKILLTDLADIGVVFGPSEQELICQTPDGTIPPELQDIIDEYGTQIAHILRGKTLIREALNQIADAWDEIETSSGSMAWNWILRDSQYGSRIRAAEEEVDRIGSKGDRAKLESACASWVSAWREAIDHWKQLHPATEACINLTKKMEQ